jgi:beta-lactamase class A
MRYSCTIFFTFLFLNGGSFAQTSPKEVLRQNLEKKIQEIVAEVDGVVGLSIRSLSSDETLSINVNGDMAFTQASAIKLPLLFELFRQVEEGRHALGELIPLQEPDITVGSGVLQHLSPGRVTMTLRDYATLMVVVSDNTATNMLIDRVGMEDVNRTMARLGLANTRLQRKMMDREAWLADRENLSTPNEQARLLEVIFQQELLNQKSTEGLLQILSIPKSSRIRTLLPLDTRVAHKTGTVPGVVVDVGIVFLPDSPFIVSAMVNWLTNPAEAEEAISEIALIAYEYFDRLARSNSYGHRQ